MQWLVQARWKCFRILGRIMLKDNQERIISVNGLCKVNLISAVNGNNDWRIALMENLVSMILKTLYIDT